MSLYALRKKIEEQINHTEVAMQTSGLTDLFRAEMDGGKLALNHCLKMLEVEITQIESRVSQLEKELLILKNLSFESKEKKDSIDSDLIEIRTLRGVLGK